MKPVRLVMEAFGPYAKATTLDFQVLHGKPLVLLHGPTGGGKTAILDAMCFALFGKTSGDERQGSDLRCDLAADDQLTRVTFDFWHKDRRLRVVREPTQWKKKSRGAGWTEHKTQAWLWDRTTTPNDFACEGVLIAEKPTHVDAKVRSVLGFTEEQFRQIVVLPQGKFRDFLSAPAKEKEKILKTLFGTAIYERITEELQHEARALETKFQANRVQQKSVLEGAGVEDIDALQIAIAEVESLIPPLETKVSLVKQMAEEAAKSLQQAEENNRLCEAKDAAQRALKTLLENEPAMQAQEHRLHQISMAKPLLPLADEKIRAQTKHARALEAEQQAVEEQRKAESSWQAAGIALNEEESDEKKSERADADKRVGELESLRAEANAYQLATAKVMDAENALEDAKRREQHHRDVATTWRIKLEALEREASKLGALEVEEVKGREAKKIYDARQQAFHTLLEVCQDQQQATALAEALAKQETKHLQQFEEAHANRKKVQLRWHQGQALRLAAELQDGAPCPVCGSTNHPDVARGANHETPSQEELDDAEVILESRRQSLESVRQTIVIERTKRENLIEKEAQIREELGADADVPMETWRERGTEILKNLRVVEMGLLTARTAHEELQKERTRGPALEEAAKAAAFAREQAALQFEKAKTTLDGLQERLPEALRDLEAFELAQQRAIDRQKALHQRYQHVRANWQEAEKTNLLANEKVKSAAQWAVETTRTQQEAEARFEEKLAESQLKQPEAYEKAISDLHNEAELHHNVQNHRSALGEARGRLEQAEMAAGSAKAVDVDEYRRRMVEAQQVADAQIKSLHEAQTRLQALVDARQRYEKLIALGKDEERRYQAVSVLSDAAAGKNARRLSLQRYVLASLLDDVLAHASERLRSMSTGRYRILRDDDLRDARQAGGLDLRIEDQYSGDTRPISTLSGGESFQAALALSLGLADVIQALSGGIRVDALFIDEGFGTLDGEALERAIEELLKLRDGGRLVGIVSHVAELRHRISSRIEVHKGERGSTLSVHPGD